MGVDGWAEAPVRNVCKVRGGRVGRSEWAGPSLGELRIFVVRVVELASGWVRVRAVGFLDLEEFEEAEGSSFEALGASWREPDPSSGVAELEGVELGEHGAGAMSWS